MEKLSYSFSMLLTLKTTILLTLSCLFPNTSYGGVCSNIDRDTLASFLLSISSSSPSLNWSLSADCCSWEGVSCDMSGRVINLSLPSRRLVGTISPSIRNLTALSQLNLSHNGLFGPLPNGFFSSFNFLRVIDLNDNRLSGSLTALDRLPSTIQTVNLSGNHFNCSIQSSFLQQSFSLETFDISNNSFHGAIPSSICNFSSSIHLLDFSINHFSGSVPHFGHCLNLVSLRAGFNVLSGPIPVDLYQLSELQELYIPNNELTGNIDERILNLTKLKIIALHGNNLTGMIPRDIGRLSSLEHLSLHSNRLYGTIPQSLTNCTNLLKLHLLRNSLGGELSTFDFSKFPRIQSVDLAYNLFTGVLPASLLSCKTLIAIRLTGNNLHGEIPPQTASLESLSYFAVSYNTLTNVANAIRILTGCKKLRVLILSTNFDNEELPDGESVIGPDGFQNLQLLSMHDCKLTGKFPQWLSKLSSIAVLAMKNNYLTGSIPGSLGGLRNLFFIDFSNNRLSGHFPVELTTLPSVVTRQNFETGSFELPIYQDNQNQYNGLQTIPPGILLRNNSLTGVIPVAIGQLKLLKVLDLSYNNLTGKIPDTLSNLVNLERLNLSGNHLSGIIPASLENLHFLSHFNISNNDLEGAIPTGGQLDTFPKASFEGNPRLCGPVLQRECTKVHDEPRKGDKSENGMVNWLGFEIGYAVSFIVCAVAVLKFTPQV